MAVQMKSPVGNMVRLLLAVFIGLTMIRHCNSSSAGGSFVPVTSIEGVLYYPDKRPFNITSRVTLNNDEYTTYSRSDDGTFVLYNVPPGIHQIDVHNPDYHFASVKVQLKEDDMDSPKCLEYAYPGAAKTPIPSSPITLYALARLEYFEKRQGFSIFSLFKNPMVMMMGVSVVMMLLTPKMMEGMEPEEKEKMKKQMEMQKDPAKMLSQLWGEMTSPEPEPETSKNNAIKSKGN